MYIHTKNQQYKNTTSYKKNTTQKLITNKNNPIKYSFIFSTNHHQPYLTTI